MKKSRTIIGFISLILFACSGQKEPITLDSLTINGRVVMLSREEYRIRNDNVYLSVPALEKHFNLIFKEIDPQGRQIGICRADLCVPVEVGKEKGMAFQEDNSYYVPIVDLMNDFGDSAEWDVENHTLKVTVEETDAGIKLESFRKTGSPPQ